MYKVSFPKEEPKFTLFFKNDEDNDVAKKITLTDTFYDEELLNIISFLPLPQGAFLDIGAGCGNYSLYFSKVLGRKTFSFEPSKEKNFLLKRTLKENELDEIVFCLGEENSDEFELNKNKGNIFHSSDFKEEIKFSANDLEMKSKQDFFFSFKRFPLLIQEKIAFLKVDCKEFDIEILQSYKDLIEKENPLVCLFAKKKESLSSIDRFMSDINYKLLDVSGDGSCLIFSDSKVHSKYSTYTRSYNSLLNRKGYLLNSSFDRKINNQISSSLNEIDRLRALNQQLSIKVNKLELDLNQAKFDLHTTNLSKSVNFLRRSKDLKYYKEKTESLYEEKLLLEEENKSKKELIHHISLKYRQSTELINQIRKNKVKKKFFS